MVETDVKKLDAIGEIIEDTSKSLIITANAGSGKTKRLVDRYMAILKNNKDKDIAKILAMTFTDKAANEMRDRVISKCDEIIKNGNDDYKKVKSELKDAKIMTIHSFCNKLLADYSLEVNLPPTVTRSDNEIENKILKDCIDKVLREYINDIDNKDKYGKLLFKLLDLSKIKEYIKDILKKRDIWTKLDELYNKTEKDGIKDIHKIIIYLLDSGDINHKEFDKKIEDFKSRLELLIERIETDNVYDEEDINGIIKELLSTKLSNTYIFNKIQISEEKKDLIKYFKKIIDCFIESFKKQFHLSKKLFELAKEANKYILDSKTSKGLISYDDMLILARDLLKNGLLVKEIANNYEHILIDEFQDTNNIQYEIIERLTEANPKIKLFIVGDEKQSIYRFRDADVSLFTKIKEKFKVNGDDYKVLSLDKTFRITPNIADFINSTCKELFKDNKIEYTKLETNVITDNIPAYKGHKINENGEIRCLGEHNIKDEAENVAKYIKKIIDEKYSFYDQREKKWKEIAYKDISILYSKNEKTSDLTDALYKYNIPFNVNGIDLYKQKEVVDLIIYLKFIDNPNDNIALFYVLSLPYFYFSFVEILQIIALYKNKIKENKISLWKFINSYHFSEQKENLEIDNKKIEIFKNKVNNIIKLSSVVSISHLLHIITLECQWYAYFNENETNKNKIKNNIELIIDQARNFQESKSSNLSKFIDYISNISSNSIKLGGTEEGNAVTLSTIHSAKGTEYPVVFLYSLNENPRSAEAPFINKEFGFSFKINFKANQFEYEDNIVTKLSRYLENKEVAEERNRLIYVALTRVKSLLVLSFNKEVKDKNKIKTIICKNNDCKGCDLNIEFVENDLAINYTENSKIELCRKNINNDFNEFYNKTCEYKITKEHHSATSLSKLFENNSIGIDNKKSTLNEEYTNEDKNKFNAKEIGTFYHLIFEKIKDWIIKDGSSYVINDNKFNEIHKEKYDEFKDRYKYYEEFSLLELKRVKDNCKKIIKKDIIQRLADNFKNANFEYEVNFSFLENGNNDNLFLQAIFDVLIKNSDGEWEILDWKTNKIMNDDDLEKIREKYQIQADLYCFILMNMYPKQDKYKMTLLLINADNTISDNKCYIEYEYNKEQINNIIKDRIKKEINRSTISVNNRFERLDKIIV